MTRGRPRKYHTEEERLAAGRADKRRWAQKKALERKIQRGEAVEAPKVVDVVASPFDILSSCFHTRPSLPNQSG